MDKFVKETQCNQRGRVKGSVYIKHVQILCTFFFAPFPIYPKQWPEFFLLIHFPGADQKTAGGSLEGASHERDERGVGAIAKIPPSGSPGKRCKEKRACVQNQREQGLISSCSVGT